MCGRFANDAKTDELIQEYVADGGKPEDWWKSWAPAFSIAPTQSAPIVRDRGEGRILELVRWDWQKMLLLQVVPSKTDRARVLLVSPELAHVLARLRQRARGDEHQVPLVIRYDSLEREFSPPLPFLFQWKDGDVRRVFCPPHSRTSSHTPCRSPVSIPPRRD